jgi:hypothetical protein
MPWLADRVPLQRGKIALNPDIPIGGDGRARILAGVVNGALRPLRAMNTRPGSLTQNYFPAIDRQRLSTEKGVELDLCRLSWLAGESCY